MMGIDEHILRVTFSSCMLHYISICWNKERNNSKWKIKYNSVIQGNVAQFTISIYVVVVYVVKETSSKYVYTEYVCMYGGEYINQHRTRY